MVCTEFNSLRPLGDELANYANSAFSSSDPTLFGVQIRVWLEKAVVGFVDAHHKFPPVTDDDLDAATRRARRPGKSQFRIDRIAQHAKGVGAYVLRAMHRTRVYGNQSNHDTPEFIERTKRDAITIRDWLKKEYVPLYYLDPQTEAKPYEAKAHYSGPSPTQRAPTSSATRPQLRQPEYATGYEAEMSVLLSGGDKSSKYYRNVDPKNADTYRRQTAPPDYSNRIFKQALITLFTLLFLALAVTWIVRAIENWWAGLPNFTELARTQIARITESLA